jgi:hypothetical protein
MTMGPAEENGRLSAADQRVLDALVECGFDPEALEAMPPDGQKRAQAVLSLFGLLRDYPVDDADPTLTHATLARIDRHEDERAARLTFQAVQAEGSAGRRAFPIRVPDFISVAAVLLIAAAVLFPVVGRVRQASIDARCADNMRALGTAFAQYAGDFDGAAPVAAAGFASFGWDGRHNLLNLKPLLQGGYCRQGHLNCPGHHDEFSGSYSYQCQDPGLPVYWNLGGLLVVLGDRNPLVDAAMIGQIMPALSISINHGGRGQNVLRNDGAVLWLRQPTIDSDNIWLPHGFATLREGARPVSARDAFLTH